MNPNGRGPHQRPMRFVGGQRGAVTEQRRDACAPKATAEIPWCTSRGVTWLRPPASARRLVVSTMQLIRLGTTHVTDWLSSGGSCCELLRSGVSTRTCCNRRWPMQVIYDKHTPMHHMIYVEEDMALRLHEGVRVSHPGRRGAGIGPGKHRQSRSPSASCGQARRAGSFCSPEPLHGELRGAAPLLPRAGAQLHRSPPLIRTMRAHHAKHHDPRLMQKWNFNVTVRCSTGSCGPVRKNKP